MPDEVLSVVVFGAIGMAGARLIPAVYMIAAVVVGTLVLAALAFFGGWGLGTALLWWLLTLGAFQFGIVAMLVVMARRRPAATRSPAESGAPGSQGATPAGSAENEALGPHGN